MATENSKRPANPTFRTLDLSAEVKKLLGADWNKPEIAYEWSNGKKHYLRTGDASIYASSPDFTD